VSDRVPPPPPPAPPPGRSTVTWIVGVAVVIALAYITLNTIRTQGPGSRGPAAGSQLPPFAMPLATSSLQGDANLATRRGEGSLGAKPACEVRGPQILNICQLAERGPVVLAFTVTRSKTCERQVDALEALRPRFPDVGFAAVAVRGSRSDLVKLIHQHRWTLPVGYDHDGAVANAYGAAVCPMVTFAYRGGRVQGTSVTGVLSGQALADRIALLRKGP
jgi:hypothetical protein